MTRTLIVTNDFPTRQGGIESFVFAVAERLPAADIVVYTASMPNDAEFDAKLAYPVVRDPRSVLLPTPAVARRVSAAMRAHDCDAVLFGAAAPLGLLAAPLRRAGAQRIVGMTHGHETWWARVPGARSSLRRIGSECDTLTYVSEFCRRRISRSLPAASAARMVRVAGGVDTEVFDRGVGGAQVRERLGIAADRPVLLSVSRLVPRKGQDTLVAAMPEILRRVPDALLLLVGDGPHRKHLANQVQQEGLGEHVLLAGAVPWSEAPAWFDVGDVFAMPCRTRLGGLEPEALGIVFLEAQSAGMPVVVGDSGGAPEAVQHGVTGFVVDPQDAHDVATRCADLLADLDQAQAMGAAGRRWVTDHWSWEQSAGALQGLLNP